MAMQAQDIEHLIRAAFPKARMICHAAQLLTA